MQGDTNIPSLTQFIVGPLTVVVFLLENIINCKLHTTNFKEQFFQRLILKVMNIHFLNIANVLTWMY